MTSHDPLSESQSRSSIARLPPFLRYRDPVYAHAYTLVALPTTRTNATAQLAAYTTSICFNVNVQRTEGISRLTPSHPTKAQRIYYAPLPEVIFFFSERKNRNPTPLFIFEERRTKTKNVSYQTKIPLSLLVLSLLSYHPRFQHLAFFSTWFGSVLRSPQRLKLSFHSRHPIHLSIYPSISRHVATYATICPANPSFLHHPIQFNHYGRPIPSTAHFRSIIMGFIVASLISPILNTYTHLSRAPCILTWPPSSFLLQSSIWYYACKSRCI